MADDLRFSSQDVENFQSAVTPEGYDWHHHEEPGKMQLVDEETHSGTGHTGGRTIWGGGTENR
ncbi:HNH endonuclease [Siminovitchia acidinfaciens]|uniref:HNH endonuclease n=1 Tax=Siminovitchia acidinfaciens TaxID=2321395 RepID=UPI0013DF5095|nr:HNH endonuclease [Siminovitchia acidinfaciens]